MEDLRDYWNGTEDLRQRIMKIIQENPKPIAYYARAMKVSDVTLIKFIRGSKIEFATWIKMRLFVMDIEKELEKKEKRKR